MKKLLFIILCCTHLIIDANNLSDAIRDNNLEMVDLLLSRQQIESSDYAKYVTITEESIRFAREQLLSQQSRPKISRRYALLALGSLCAMISSAIYSPHKYSDIIRISSPIIVLTLILMGIRERYNHYQQEYDNALKIQDLILGL